jgi:alcohol dehydrogenase class IV
MTSLFGLSRFPRNLIFGRGQRGAVAANAAAFGKRALVVTDERMAASGECRDLVQSLEGAGLRATLFDGTVAELPAESIAAGVAAGKAANADVIIGLGGGSCMDAAKLIALLLSHGGQLSDYYGEFKVPGPILPVIAVPTTSGTGSEVTPVAVVSDPDRAVKVGIASPHLIPHVAICDPDLTDTCPPGLTAVSGADALTHAIEAYTTLRREPYPGLAQEHVFVGKNAFSDYYAIEAVRLIAANLRRACENGADRDARDALMLGSTYAGLAFGVAGTAAAHAVQYPVGALTHTPHGAGVAVMMPYVMQFNLSHAAAELAEISTAMGVATSSEALTNAQAAIEAVAELFASIGIPGTIKDLGLSEDKIEWTAEAALGAARLVKNNPHPLDKYSMLALVRAAFSGDRASLISG